MTTSEKFTLNAIKERFNTHDIEINATVKMEVEINVFHNEDGELCVCFNVPCSDKNAETNNYLEYIFNLEPADGSRKITLEDVPIALEISPDAEIWEENRGFDSKTEEYSKAP